MCGFLNRSTITVSNRTEVGLLIRISLSLITATRALNQFIICWCQLMTKAADLLPWLTVFTADMFSFPTLPCFISETVRVKVDYVESEALALFPGYFCSCFFLTFPARIHEGAKIHTPNLYRRSSVVITNMVIMCVYNNIYP